MYTQANRFRHDDNFSGSSTPITRVSRATTQKVWMHGHRKPRLGYKNKMARRFTAGRKRHNDNGHNNNNNNITSLHDITLKIHKLYDDIANQFTTNSNSPPPPPPFKPINYNRIHKRWKNKKFKQQVGGVKDCLDNMRPESVTVRKNPDGSETFIVEKNTTDPNVTGSLDEVAKELMKQPNPPGTTPAVKFPAIVPPATDPDPAQPDLIADEPLLPKTYDASKFQKMYGAEKPEPVPEPVPAPKPKIDPNIVRQRELIMAAAAIAIIGAAGAIEDSAAKKKMEEAAAAAAAEAKKKLTELQNRLALSAAAAGIAGLGALGATEDTDAKKRLIDEIDKIIQGAQAALDEALRMQVIAKQSYDLIDTFTDEKLKEEFAGVNKSFSDLKLHKDQDKIGNELQEIEEHLKFAIDHKTKCVNCDGLKNEYEKIEPVIQIISGEIQKIQESKPKFELSKAQASKKVIDKNVATVKVSHDAAVATHAKCEEDRKRMIEEIRKVSELIGEAFIKLGEHEKAKQLQEEEAERQRKAAEEEKERLRKLAEAEAKAKRNYEMLTAAAAIAAIAAAGAIEGVEPENPKPVVPPIVELPWESLYMKWMQVTENSIYDNELVFNALTDSEADVTAPITDDVDFTRKEVKTALDKFATTDINDKDKVTFTFDSAIFDAKYNKENVFKKLNDWVTKWKEFGGAIRTFIAFKTSKDEQAGGGDPYKITTADLLAEIVIMPKININPTDIFAKFVAWMTADNYAIIKQQFETNNIVIDTKEIIEGAVIDVATDDEIKQQFKKRFQTVYLCKLILLRILKPDVLEELYLILALNNAVDALTKSENKSEIVGILKRISDSQFNEMYVHYNPLFIDTNKIEKPILPKILLDAFPYRLDETAAAAAVPPEYFKDVLYGKFYSVWDSSVIGNKARYENGKFNSLIKVIESSGNVVLFGYGYSGSGKTYTLTNEDAVNNDDWGIGPKIVEEMISKGYTYNATVDELYSNDITFDKNSGFGFGKTKVANILKSAKKTKIEYTDSATGRNIHDLISMFKRVKNIRLKEGRIKATINNPESSRGHLFYNIEFTNQSGNNKGKLVICDMGGREDPLEMAKNTFIVLEGDHIGQLAQYKGYAGKGKHKFDVWNQKTDTNGKKIDGFINETTSLLIHASHPYVVPITKDAFEIYPFKDNPQSFIKNNLSLISAFGTFEIDDKDSIKIFVNKHKNTDKVVDSRIVNTIIDFFIACKEGFFINETINHLTSYVNYLSMMDESLSSIKLLDTAITAVDAKKKKSIKDDIKNANDYKPTQMIQDPRRIILKLEKDKYTGSVISDKPYSICKLQPNTTMPQDDYFGLITKLFELKRPATSELSIICVMACIRTSHEKSSDDYRAATGKTLNFAISVSASNPVVRKRVDPVRSDPSSGTQASTYTPPIIRPTNYTAGAIADFIIKLFNKVVTPLEFKGIQDRGFATSGAADKRHLFKYYSKGNEIKDKHTDLLDQFWKSSVYSEWMKNENRQKPLEQVITKENVLEALQKRLVATWRGGAIKETRRKRKSGSGGNKRTRRIR